MSELIPPPLSDDDARRKRLEALSALAYTQPNTPAPAPPLSTSRSRQPLLIIGSVLLVIVLVAGIVLHQLGEFPGKAAQTHTGPTSLVIAPSLQDLDCLHNIAWSPNGQQVAVIGYRDQCPSDDPSSYNYQAGVLHIYAVATGKLVQTILPDPTVLALPGTPSPPANAKPASAAADTSKTAINYTQVLWSPDGKELALTFLIERWNAADTAPLPGFRGLVLVDTDGKTEHAGLVTETNQRYYCALKWSTATLSALELPPQPRSGYFASLPPAQSYSWTSSGQLVPGSSLTAASSPSTPIGNPDGGSAFTIWQPGSISLTTEGETPNKQFVAINPGVYSWGTDFPVWSPDGHYLIDSFVLSEIVHPVGEPSPSADGLKALGLESMPNLTIRDLALQRLLTTSLHATTGQGSPPQPDDLAWSPNGRVLAAIPEPSLSGPSSGSTTSPSVTFYDCTTGKTLEALQPQANSQISANSQVSIDLFVPPTLLRWSFNGSHFLLYSQPLGTITIWGSGVLPKSS